MGVATAATQIEGGEVEHSWMDWSRQGKISDGSSPARADDHYRLWKEDAALMQDMGIRHYRLGLEWARIEPRENEFDQEAIDHYRAEITLLREYGITPLLTLHHFTNPMWFENSGAFLNKKNIPLFLAFVERMVTEFGDLVNEYITINEPNVYSVFSYMQGTWPPGRRSLWSTVRVMHNLAAAHIAAYALIHRLRDGGTGESVRVGFAHHLRVWAPKNPNSIKDKFFVLINRYFFQGYLTNALLKHKYCDFIGLNYYSRSAVSGIGDGTAVGVPVNDLGWEIYPPGIVECAEELYAACPLPIYVTENGACDNQDTFRSRYIMEHLQTIAASSLPFERYYHWSFCDNFEWAEGESARFGLVHVDYETQKRTIKESGQFYTDIIKNNGVTEAAYQQYAVGQNYRRNHGN
ncbi:glycosyl hydrolase [Spirochaetia bacterium]|nr:glycosyl hydrolase [Spirochaetia bacterium]